MYVHSHNPPPTKYFEMKFVYYQMCNHRVSYIYSQANVEFVDYGGCDQVPVSELKRLPEKCQHLPLQGIKASLGSMFC